MPCEWLRARLYVSQATLSLNQPRSLLGRKKLG